LLEGNFGYLCFHPRLVIILLGVGNTLFRSIVPQETSFADIVDAASGLSLDEQQTLFRILGNRIADLRREQLKEDVKQARAEYATGRCEVLSAEEIIDEARP